MKKQDFSRDIFNKYYHSEGRVLKITLKDKTILEGVFAGFFHGDAESNEPYIIKWHFLDKNEIPKYPKYRDTLLAIQSQEEGKIIEQKDIESVEFE